jgi:ABC-2 type transport system ATP-binding protein
MENVILQVEGLTKRYGDLTVVDHISFQLKEGEVVGLIGPNGAGKTTTIHMLLSLLEPTEGTIEVFGQDLSKHRVSILEKINFAAPYAALPHNLSIRENLIVFALLYNVPNVRERVEALIQDFRLTKFRNTKTGALSSGEQTRLGLAKAFLNNPQLLLLDEPTASLDPLVAKEFRSHIQERMKAVQGAILWTSHNMREIETMCTRVIFLLHGKIVADDTPENLRRKFQKQDLEEIFLSVTQASEIAYHQA